MFYFVRPPNWLRSFYPGAVWQLPSAEKLVYLSFDDGPTPQITDFVLDELKSHQAKASFFCLGSQVEKHPHLFQRIIHEEHAVGNHSYSHLSAWNCRTSTYLADVVRASALIKSSLFRPPYGRLWPAQLKGLKQRGFTTVMWSLTAGDFDPGLTAEQCLRRLMLHLHPGAIVLLHDNVKAEKKLHYVLPRLLYYCQQKGFTPASLNHPAAAKFLAPLQ